MSVMTQAWWAASSASSTRDRKNITIVCLSCNLSKNREHTAHLDRVSQKISLLHVDCWNRKIMSTGTALESYLGA